MDIEIEIKVKVDNTADFIDFLKDNGAFRGKHHQIDTYYTPAHRDFTKVRPTEEWLRLRNSQGKYSINYKKWIYGESGKSEYCDEYETPVGDIGQMEKIFTALNIKSVCVVDKVRQIWNYQDYEISLDSVAGLGEFIEIEYKAKASPEKAVEITDGMISFLKRFNPGNIYRNFTGYPFQLLFPDESVVELIS